MKSPPVVGIMSENTVNVNYGANSTDLEEKNEHQILNPSKKQKVSHETISSRDQPGGAKKAETKNGEGHEKNSSSICSEIKSKVNENKKATTKKPKTKHIDPEILKLRRSIQMSIAKDDLHTAMEAYQNMHINNNVKMEPSSFYCLLNLCAGGIAERVIHIGTPKPGKGADNHNKQNPNVCPTDSESVSSSIKYSSKERKKFAFQIKNEMDKLEIPLNETSYTGLIRILCHSENNDLEEAERLLNKAENTQQCKPRVRMYGCLIDAFCSELNNDLAGALRVWGRLSKLRRKDKEGNLKNRMQLTEKEYCSIMKCAIRVGDRLVMERILSEVAEDILVPSLKTKDTIIAWFQSEHAIDCDERSERRSALSSVSGLPTCNAPSLGPICFQPSKVIRDKNNFVKSESCRWGVTSGDAIDSSSGELLTGSLKGQRLSPVQLSKESWKKMLDMNNDIVVKGEVTAQGKTSCAFAGGGKGKKRVLGKFAREKRISHWESFKMFLHETVGPPLCDSSINEGKRKIDIVIDGANVGYYKMNFTKAPKHVDYHKIDRIVRYFENEKKNILLFMHERHFDKDLMPRWAESIVNKWEKSGILYRTPYGSNDDWFWMHTALWCGRQTMVLSNDLMRDHHFQMLAHRSFLRWKERHQVFFEVGKSMKSISLTYPDKYSRRIQRIPDQGIVIPLPKKGDMNRFLDGQHEADDTASCEETYVSIAMPNI